MAPSWFFDKVLPGTMERNPVSEEFFTNGTRLEAVVRESLQNSLDAADGGNVPVEVRIFFSGENDQLQPEQLQPYFPVEAIQRFTDPKNGLVAPDQVMAGACRFLVIEDFHTTGLTGETMARPLEEDLAHQNNWNYYNYFFRENGSTKVDANTLGSWGAGKCVFQRASRLKCSFSYSVRDNYEPRAFVAGKATLKFHTDVKHVTWAPDGWFGLKQEEEDPCKMQKLPITDPQFITKFKKDFNIMRNDEPGTSIVIPYINLLDDSENEGAAFTERNLVSAVLRNFLVAIHEGKLKVVVQVGKQGVQKVVDKANVKAYQTFLPTPEERDALVTQLHHDLILGSPNFSASQQFTLKSPGDEPAWDRNMFDEVQLNSLRKLLHEKTPCRIAIPIPIRKKTADGMVKVEEGKFIVLLKRQDLQKSLPPVFYRAGLLIDAVATSNLNNYIAAVLIEHDALADLLVAAEPPSHSKWNYATDRVVKKYDKPRKHIQYVSYAVRKIIDMLADFDQTRNYDPLSDVFGIKKNKSDNKNNDATSAVNKSGGNDGGNDVDQPRNTSIVAIDIINGQGQEKGIRIKNGEKLAQIPDEKFPFIAKFYVGYDTFRGLDWSQNDFILGENGSGDVTLSVTKGTVDLRGQENMISLTIKNKDPFCVEITGFDPNRDVTVSQLRYIYPKEEPKDGVSI